MSWFEVDKEGLAKIVADRGKVFILHELIQNAWDEPETTRVEVVLESAPYVGRGLARLRVTDDNPRGFVRLEHAFTLFAESLKKGDETQRGRFNFGEKLVLALCRDASIVSTTGTVNFNKDGSRTRSKVRRPSGTVFTATVAMTLPEIAEASHEILLLLPPARVTTIYNGHKIPTRKALLTFNAALPTVKADDEGALRPTVRQTTVEVHEPQEGEEPMLFEMGLPVMPWDRFHVNVGQKVPLNMTRDNVTPSYQRQLRALVLNETASLLTKEDVTAAWVGSALEDKRASPEAVALVVNERFGADAVVRDPSDLEANHRAVAAGVGVVGPGTFSKAAWDNIKEAGVLPAAGKVFPTPRAYGDGPVARYLEPDKWSPEIKEVVRLAKSLAEKLMGVALKVTIVNDLGMTAAACYSRDGRLDLNLARLGHTFFNYHENPERVLDLLLHEFGHHYASNHLSDDYYRALTKLGARLAVAAVRDLTLLKV